MLFLNKRTNMQKERESTKLIHLFEKKVKSLNFYPPGVSARPRAQQKKFLIICNMSDAQRSEVRKRSDFAYHLIAVIKNASERALSANERARSVPYGTKTRRNGKSARDARAAARSNMVPYTTGPKRAKAEKTILDCMKILIFTRSHLLEDEDIPWSVEYHGFENDVFTSLLLGIDRRAVTGGWHQMRCLNFLALFSTICPTQFWSDDDLGTATQDRFWRLPAKRHCLIDRDSSSF